MYNSRIDWARFCSPGGTLDYLRRCRTVHIMLRSANTRCHCVAVGDYMSTTVSCISPGTALRLCPFGLPPPFCRLPLSTAPRSLTPLPLPQAIACLLFSWSGSSILLWFCCGQAPWTCLVKPTIIYSNCRIYRNAQLISLIFICQFYAYNCINIYA